MSDPLGGLGDVGDFEEPPERPDPYSRIFEEMKAMIDRHVIRIAMAAAIPPEILREYNFRDAAINLIPTGGL